MSLLTSTPREPVFGRRSAGSTIGGSALIVGAALVLVGAGFVLGTQRSPAPIADTCALPGGTELSDLDPHDASLATRRLLACNDLRFGRITHDEYRVAIATIDKQWTPAPAPPPRIVWASSVRGFSTQYTASQWSAAQALGAPNVPSPGDNANAWASLGADDRDEWLEVGFENAGRVNAVEIYETYNPGCGRPRRPDHGERQDDPRPGRQALGHGRDGEHAVHRRADRRRASQHRVAARRGLERDRRDRRRALRSPVASPAGCDRGARRPVHSMC
jgi:hypothetical protein